MKKYKIYANTINGEQYSRIMEFETLEDVQAEVEDLHKKIIGFETITEFGYQEIED